MAGEHSGNASIPKEWTLLQAQFHAYEQWALMLKLSSLLVLALLLFHTRHDYLAPLICAILWGQEAIIKTFQQRTADRLLAIEADLSQSRHEHAMQFHTSWQINRPSGGRLLKQYAVNALRPTVVYPHGLIVLSACYVAILG